MTREYDDMRRLVDQWATVPTDGPWHDVATLVVRAVLTSPTCAAARAGQPCTCGCVGVLVRHVQEHFERACSAAVQVSKRDICET